MNGNDRSDYLQGLLNALGGLYYYINNFNSIGIMYYDIADLYNIQVGEITYQCIMLNDEINVKSGIEEIIYTEMPEQSQTDYTKADKTDRRINETYLIVDKQNQVIQGVVSDISEQNEQIAEIRLQYNELLSRISDIADITTSGESSYASVNLVDVNTSQPISIKIHPITTNISYTYPMNTLYPSDTLYMKNRVLRFRNTTTNETFYWELPTDLWYYSSTVYDELELSYGDGTNSNVIVTRRCTIDSTGTVSQASSETTETYSYPTNLVLSDGDYTIDIPSYSTGYLYVQLMAKNIYTTQFYTKAETNSLIDQTASSIDLSVDTKLSNYSTTTEMNSAINVKADQINSVVSTKVGNDEVISKINQSSEAVAIDANKISLVGKQINLTGDNTTITSTNFSVDANGNVTANNASLTSATISGGNITLSSDGTKSIRVMNSQHSSTSYMTYITNNVFGINSGSYSSEFMAGGSYEDNTTLCGISITDAKGFSTLYGRGLKTPSITSTGIYNNTTSSSPNLWINAYGEFYRSTNTSSERYKTDIKDLENKELNPHKLYELKIKQFKYKDDYLTNTNDSRYNADLIGFIAEDVEKVYPIAVDYITDEKGNKLVENWNEKYIIPAMLQLIQEQKHQIDKLEEKIKKLEEGK